MNKPENTYCRLCAQLKPYNKLLDLQENYEKLQEVIIKLSKLSCKDPFEGESLPKTVCFVCTDSLDKAFEFVQNIEQAQAVLNGLLIDKKIKKELIYFEKNSESDNDNFEPLDDVKFEETVSVKKEKIDDKSNIKGKRRFRKLKSKSKVNASKIGLDSIPLSQLKLTWKDYNWLCAYCETEFQSLDELTSHSKQFHICCNPYRCSDCNTRKLRLDSFLVHVKRHRKYLKLSCYRCSAKFSSTQEVKKHLQVKHEASEYLCMGCNSDFDNVEDLNDHSMSFYKDKKLRKIPDLNSLADNLTCLLCKKSFKSKGSLNTHLLTHTDRTRNHTCDKCGKCFFNKHTLLGHLLLHDDTRPFQCQICKFGFKTKAQLRSHVGVHGGVKPYACDQCGRCFRLPRQLKSHQIIHTDSLPYVCTYCNKAFRFKTILNQHVRQHTGVKPYTCQHCQRDFTNWPNYNKHMKRRHGMEMAKKKHTPDGVYPINPLTGDIMMYPENEGTAEWKKTMMEKKRIGRPKMVQDDIDGKNVEVQVLKNEQPDLFPSDQPDSYAADPPPDFNTQPITFSRAETQTDDFLQEEKNII